LPKIDRQGRKWIYDILFGSSLLKDASKVITLNKIEVLQYKYARVQQKRITTLPNGINLSEYTDLPVRGSFKRKYGLPKNKKIVLFLGRLNKIKGIEVLIKAFVLVSREFKDAILVLAGPNDGYLDELESLIKTLECKNVLFPGPLYGTDKLEAYVDSEVYVLPSIYEMFPMGLLEAYACSKPVVASRVGGITDLVIPGETGLLFNPRDVNQLAFSIISILADDSKAMKLGTNGKIFVSKNFAIDTIAKRLEALYEEILCAS
jgi:glycosyltransferase involved in cell wall biosynthesis